MNEAITKTRKTCSECGREYEAHIGEVSGIKIEFGGGLCPECRLKKLKEAEQKEAEARQQEIEEIKRRWRAECGLPIRFQKSQFDNFDTKVDGSIAKMWRMCQDYLASFSIKQPHLSPSLVMYSQGIWGLGKTHLVCALANALIDRYADRAGRCPVYFVSEPQLFLKIRSTYNRRNDRQPPQETEEEIYRRLTTVPLLILDDVGKEEVSDPRFVQRVLFAVIDGRYQNMLPVIITANLSPDDLDSHLGGNRGNSASMDRLAEMTGNVFWELKGQTYRDLSKRRS